MAKKANKVLKSKKAIVSEIQLTQDADRRRALIKDVIFPYLLELNDNIGYTKVFLQSLSSVINGEFDETRKTITVGDIKGRIEAKLNSIFTMSDPVQKKEYERYMGLVNKLMEVSVQDFSYAAELPRYIDGFITKTKDKSPISEIDILTILG